MYLEFISAVTEDILSREFISDRFLLFVWPFIYLFQPYWLKSTHRCSSFVLCKGPGSGLAATHRH